MEKKVLVISPVPSHPPIAGNRIRILNLLNNLKKLGCKIHFLFYNNFKDKSDNNAMRKAWNKFSYFFSMYDLLYEQVNTNIGRIGKYIKPRIPPIYNILKPFFPDRNISDLRFGKKTNVDRKYAKSLHKYIQNLCKKKHYDIVIAEYILMSKALELFPKDTLKIIDTHDIFTNRMKNVGQSFFSVPAYEETKALKRADIIIAIQDNEAEYFKRLVGNEPKVITIGHSVKLIKPELRKKLTRKILFVGSTHTSNRKGINLFIKDVVPILKKEIPEIELVIAGSICKFIPKSGGYRSLGIVKNLAQVYEDSDIVVAPIFKGTGLKIKVIEALGMGRPVIATSHAIEGLEQLTKIKNTPLIRANTPMDFIMQIKRLLEDKNYNKRCNNAYNFAKKYNKGVMKNLKRMINTKIKK